MAIFGQEPCIQSDDKELKKRRKKAGIDGLRYVAIVLAQMMIIYDKAGKQTEQEVAKTTRNTELFDRVR